MKDKVITENTAEFLRYLIDNKKAFFTVRDAKNFMPSFAKDYIQELLQNLIDRELALRIKRGLYVMLPYDTVLEEFSPNRHLTASELVGKRSYYIGYYTALQLHDLTTQPALVEQVVVNKQMTPTEQSIHGVKFQFIYHNKKHFFGIKKTWVEYINQSYVIKYSDLEKTIIDCLFKPDYAGGIVEIGKAIYRVGYKMDYTKLLNYINQMQSQSVIKRLGFLLELYRIETPIIDQLQALKTASITVLDPIHPKQGRIQNRWSIQVNIDLDTMLQAPVS
ncbi:type IV toxin-antitoxin system AbiEi family antitoxin domain-containing protein [Wocania ichthyoenteri]|uniref:type IV toxin-antitoxin system AbiEi family antitoxin domain-containing protein n=1 Tax=Wocania ichthyoenteri TaxID=1230531 RepID=UPI00053E1398|nr:type IV toxin-antitoxin system AbiEi family antitoxin [Wocania ichthyoenteri]